MSKTDMLVTVMEMAEEFGEVETVRLYENGFTAVGGKTKEGKSFKLTLFFDEEVKDGN